MATSVWYIGRGDREISALDWAKHGLLAPPVKWNSNNGWSVPQSNFSAVQLAVLASYSTFLLGQEGPRTGNPQPVGQQALASASTYYAATKALYDSIDEQNLVSASDPGKARASIDAAQPKVQITDNCFCIPISTGTFVGTYEWFHRVGVSAVDIQLVFGNWTSVQSTPQIDVDVATSFTFKASIRIGGNNYPVTFNGLLTATAGPGPGPLVSDPVSVEVTKGDQISTLVYLASGTAQTNRVYAGFSGGGGVSGAADLTAKGAAAVADINTGVGAGGPAPIAIIGTPLESGIPKALIQLGDSIAHGTDLGYQAMIGHFPSMPWVSGGGFVHRSVVGEAGFIQAGINSDQMQWFNAPYGHFRRASVLKYCRYAFIGYGHNDLHAGRTPAQLQQDLLTCGARNKARGVVKNIVMTLIPHSTSTDGWATVNNQTANWGAEANRVIHNTWVRDGGPIDPVTLAPVATGTVNALRFGDPKHPIDAYLEVANSVESLQNSGKWKALGRRVTDAAITTGTATVTSATASFTAADVGATIFIAGAGAAGAALAGTIKSVTNSTTAVLFSNAATTVSGAGMTIGALTADGIHPWVTGHAYISNVVKDDLLELIS